MYSVVLAAMLTAGTATPDFFFRHAVVVSGGCCGGYASCYGGCGGYASCYGGCGGCWGGCGGCWGGAAYASCYGCSGYSSCYGCGGCTGYTSCFGGCGGCTGYASCSGGFPAVVTYSSGCGGCTGCYGQCYGYLGSAYGYQGGHLGYQGSCFGMPSSCFGGVIGSGVTGYYGGSCVGCYGGGYSSTAPVVSGSIGLASAAPSTPTTVGGPATVLVKASTDTKIEVNGFNLVRKGEEQSFATPTLSSTGKHTYEFVATLTRDGQTVTKTRTIEVRPGGESRVDFSELVTELTVKKDRATVAVTLPEDADLFVDGVKMTATGTARKFQTPPLTSGQTYTYELRATTRRDGHMHEATQRVRVEPGKESPVEFTETAFVKVIARTVAR